jgi:DNA-3-methyladenine glycosylase II
MSSPQPPSFTPDYWDEACRHLSRRDRVMKRLIPQFGQARLQCRGDAFTTLARSIVGQQISVKAAQAVWERLSMPWGGAQAVIKPSQVLKAAAPELRAAGLSVRKVEYLQDLARHFKARGAAEPAWDDMEDEAVIAELVCVRGIGRWTAEMFLMFGLMRPDVLPIDDLGLLKGISLNYFSGEPVTRSEAREVGEAWAPYRSVATWYLWRSLDPVPVEY